MPRAIVKQHLKAAKRKRPPGFEIDEKYEVPAGYKMAANMKEAVQEAARIIGGQGELIGYFLKLHCRDYRLFAEMVRNTFPMSATVVNDITVTKFSREQIISELGKRGIDESTIKLLDLEPKDFQRMEEEEKSDDAVGPGERQEAA